MKGKLVKTAIKISGKTQQEAADFIGITREHLNKLLKADVPDEYITLLKNKGIEFDNVVKSNTESDIIVLKPSNSLHEGKALQFYLKLEHGMISRFAKQMGYTTNVYMYELFAMDKIPDITWAQFEDKAQVKKNEVIEKYINFQKTIKTNPTGSVPVPVYDIDFTAGDVTQFADFPEKVIGHIDLNGFRKCIAFVKVRGNSMFPTFTAGDLVGLEPQEDFSIIEYGQPFAIVTKSGQSLIKIIRKGESKDNLILRSNNKEFDDIDIHKNDILRLYKAHGPVRDSHY